MFVSCVSTDVKFLFLYKAQVIYMHSIYIGFKINFIIIGHQSAGGGHCHTHCTVAVPVNSKKKVIWKRDIYT